ncbi:O-antigen ligase family protein [Pseudomonas sp. NyZ704]|nr:O-antigen ligase family protein [Pseudomonas sp. NyZ704]
MHFQQRLDKWLGLGILWFLVGIVLFESHKPYRQGLIFLYWVPVVMLLATQLPVVKDVWRRAKPVVIVLGILIVWAALSLLWSPDDRALRELRRLLFVSLFLSGFAFFGLQRPQSVNGLLRLACHLLALSCLVALVSQYAGSSDLTIRAEGLGQLDHPILGGYAIAVAVMLLAFLPHPQYRVLWLASLLVMVMFIILTQSRGLWLAFLSTLMAMAVLRGGRTIWIATAVLLAVAAVGFVQFHELILERGMSYRPEILRASFDMIQQRPWLGLGLGVDYDISVPNSIEPLPHSHNLLAHVAIELGVIGLALWIAVWGCVLHAAWIMRHIALGRALLAVMIFCTVAQMFDGGQLWESPRADWFFTWLPVGLGLCLLTAYGRPEGVLRQDTVKNESGP